MWFVGLFGYVDNKRIFAKLKKIVKEFNTYEKARNYCNQLKNLQDPANNWYAVSLSTPENRNLRKKFFSFH